MANKKEMEAQEKARRHVAAWDNERLESVATSKELLTYNPIFQEAIRTAYEQRKSWKKPIKIEKEAPSKKETTTEYGPKIKKSLAQIRSKIRESPITSEKFTQEFKFTTSDNKKHFVEIKIDENTNIEEAVLSALSKKTDIPTFLLTGSPHVKDMIRDTQRSFESWIKSKPFNRDLLISKQLQQALTRIENAEVEFGGYLEPGPKQELHIIEGDKGSVCHITPNRTTIAFHTHPPNGSASPSRADLAGFLGCPFSIGDMIIGQEDIFAAYKTRPLLIEADAEDYNELYRAIIAEKDLPIKIIDKSEALCYQTEGVDCRESYKHLEAEVFKILQQEFGVVCKKYSKNQDIRMKV
jgi:hypothetical protein